MPLLVAEAYGVAPVAVGEQLLVRGGQQVYGPEAVVRARQGQPPQGRIELGLIHVRELLTQVGDRHTDAGGHRVALRGLQGVLDPLQDPQVLLGPAGELGPVDAAWQVLVPLLVCGLLLPLPGGVRGLLAAAAAGPAAGGAAGPAAAAAAAAAAGGGGPARRGPARPAAGAGAGVAAVSRGAAARRRAGPAAAARAAAAAAGRAPGTTTTVAQRRHVDALLLAAVAGLVVLARQVRHHLGGGLNTGEGQQRPRRLLVQLPVRGHQLPRRLTPLLVGDALHLVDAGGGGVHRVAVEGAVRLPHRQRVPGFGVFVAVVGASVDEAGAAPLLRGVVGLGEVGPRPVGHLSGCDLLRLLVLFAVLVLAVLAVAVATVGVTVQALTLGKVLVAVLVLVLVVGAPVVGGEHQLRPRLGSRRVHHPRRPHPDR